MKTAVSVFFLLTLQAAAGVVSTSFSCNSPFSPSSPSTGGPITDPSCDITNTFGSQASALAMGSAYMVSAQAAAECTICETEGNVNANATASYSATLTFTIFGSSGAGTVEMLFYESTSWGDFSDGESTVSLGSYTSGLSISPGTSEPEDFVSFTFGVPFTLNLNLSAFADASGTTPDADASGSALAGFNGPVEVTQDSEPVSFTFTEVEGEATPEPSTQYMLMVGLASFVIVGLKRRYRESTGCDRMVLAEGEEIESYRVLGTANRL